MLCQQLHRGCGRPGCLQRPHMPSHTDAAARRCHCCSTGALLGAATPPRAVPPPPLLPPPAASCWNPGSNEGRHAAATCSAAATISAAPATSAETTAADARLRQLRRLPRCSRQPLAPLPPAAHWRPPSGCGWLRAPSLAGETPQGRVRQRRYTALERTKAQRWGRPV